MIVGASSWEICKHLEKVQHVSNNERDVQLIKTDADSPRETLGRLVKLSPN